MDIIEQIASAGIVGCGGAGFPTHRKLSRGVEYFIVNGAECEPLLFTDQYIMRNKAPQLVRAIEALRQELGIARCVIAVKGHYHAEVAALRQAIAEQNAEVSIHELESFYPAGDEQTIVYEVTGRVVPPGGLPIAAGAVVDNIATVCAIADALDGVPLTQKYLTVTGEVRKPTVLRVPIGTSLRECLELAGGTVHRDFMLISGGPMMGKIVPADQLDGAVVTKTTSGILALPAGGYHARTSGIDLQRMLRQARSACIQCTSCTQLCPRHLLGHPLEPHRIMRKLSMGGLTDGLLADPDIYSARLCCECGLCEVYACPMGLFPRTINRMLKQKLGAAKVQGAFGELSQPSPCREERKAPSRRVAARAGVGAYSHLEIRELVCAEPDRVSIPLQMHIGAPAVPVVSVGERVSAGELIARPEADTLSAAVHASISGTVKAVDTRIVIAKE